MGGKVIGCARQCHPPMQEQIVPWRPSEIWIPKNLCPGPAAVEDRPHLVRPNGEFINVQSEIERRYEQDTNTKQQMRIAQPGRVRWM